MYDFIESNFFIVHCLIITSSIELSLEKMNQHIFLHCLVRRKNSSCECTLTDEPCSLFINEIPVILKTRKNWKCFCF